MSEGEFIFMNINISNCYESLQKAMDQVSSVLEPLQKDNYDIRLALVNVRLMYVTATNILDEYKNMKEH